MIDPSQRGIVESIPEKDREWFLRAVGEMVDVLVYRRLKSDLDKLMHEVQEVLDGSKTGTSRKKGGKEPQKRAAVNDYVDHTEPVTVQGAEEGVLLQWHHPFCTETFPNTEDRDRHVSVVHSGYTINSFMITSGIQLYMSVRNILHCIRFISSDKEIDGEALLELRTCSGDELTACGLITLGAQLKLRRLLNRLCADGTRECHQFKVCVVHVLFSDRTAAPPSRPSNCSTSSATVGSAGTNDRTCSCTCTAGAGVVQFRQRDKKLTIAEMKQLSHGVRNTYIAK